MLSLFSIMPLTTSESEDCIEFRVNLSTSESLSFVLRSDDEIPETQFFMQQPSCLAQQAFHCALHGFRSALLIFL